MDDSRSIVDTLSAVSVLLLGLIPFALHTSLDGFWTSVICFYCLHSLSVSKFLDDTLLIFTFEETEMGRSS